MVRSEYLALRRPYEPSDVRLVIVAESPPVSGKYFYDPGGSSTGEPLFSAVMQRLGLARVATKEEGLRAFQRAGWVLVDATYEPVNREGITRAQRSAIILGDYPHLCEDLRGLAPTAPVILVKANVCRLLAPRLRADGFRVLNGDDAIHFPSHGRQPVFHSRFAAALAGLS
jgi:hypothetical protein